MMSKTPAKFLRDQSKTVGEAVHIRAPPTYIIVQTHPPQKKKTTKKNNNNKTTKFRIFLRSFKKIT